jgi:hypothetical protein
MTLANLFSKDALQHLLQTFPMAFKVILHQAANEGDLSLASRALEILDSAQIARLSDTGITYHDGKLEQDLRHETLLHTLIRVLDGRTFGSEGIAYVDKLLDTAPASAGTYCLTHAITAPVEPAIRDHLVERVRRPAEITTTPFKLQGHRLEMTPLAAAVAAGKPQVFAELMGQASQEANEALRQRLTQEAAVIQRDRNLNPTTFRLAEWITAQANSGHAAAFFESMFALAAPTDAEIDHLLNQHCMRLLGTPPRATTQGQPPADGRDNSTRHETAKALLKFRPDEVSFSDDLLHAAVRSACWPVLQAATGSNTSLQHYLSWQPDPVQVLNLAMQAPAATQTDVNRCFEILTANGIDINTRSRQPSEKTILFEAAKQGKIESAEALLELGADPDIKDTRGRKAATEWKDPSLRARFSAMADSNKAKAAIATTIALANRKRQATPS